ncbi:MAG: HEAT repeat domain-containing protein [Chloroflexi bacterium]|nr:HEAT repeat domain-containing protein [Chloroflexota bacterium]
MADKAEVDRLIRQLSGRDQVATTVAAHALAKLGDTSTMPALTEALSDSRQYVREAAAYALDQLDTSVPALIKALWNSEDVVRRWAAEALGKLGDTSAVPALINALSDSDEHVRRAAALALGGLGDKSAVPALIKALADSDEDVRGFAAQALERLGVTQRSQITMESFTAEPPPMVGVVSSLAGSVANHGEGPAVNLSLTLSSPALVNEQHTRLAFELGAGESVPWAFSIVPSASGGVPVSWAITFDDVNGPGQRITGTEHMEVEPASPTTVSVGTVYEGPVDHSRTTVEGDVLAAGAIKQGEGVIVDKKEVSQPVGSSGFCPSCGEELTSARAPKFCPGCGEALADAT